MEVAREIEWAQVMAYVDDRMDYGEVREIGYVVVSERLYCVAFTQRGDTMRTIILRKASKGEVKDYVEQTEGH
ncbi:BrnT family toxin [Paraburkholderia azotifigens]|uniref:BrnT family toxin n=1 Tax=Paraburkholderia TaxID=1822464 RepID=UPI0019811781|nr:BrnT family toxin [Paraburkholderia sp. Tr-20389]MBN3758170.1 BrnT family toxin [Paraburkholderia sp. Tr-20389]